MKKNYYFILDSQLDRLHKEQIDRGKEQKEITIKAAEDLTFKEKHNVTQVEIDEMNEKLQSDGYIRYPYPIQSPTYFLITFSGYLFIQNGKYTEKNRIAKIEILKQSLINFSLIFGGLAAGVYYIVELLC
ncbi:MAG: hypothetical protein IPN99_01360 [Bacteroidetes bacterium]|nr:hypothetical protein [Bacteroidota bacterium]